MIQSIPKLAAMLDHTQLKAYAGQSEIQTLCQEAVQYGCGAVMVHPSQARRCRELLAGAAVRIGTVIGFPLGQNALSIKLAEAKQAIEDGAAEIDYVIHIGEAKDGNWAYLENEMRQLTELCHQAGAIIKVIFEICYLTDEEIRRLAEMAAAIRPDFIKTSTGFGSGGATVEAVRLMKEAGSGVQVKAAGGVRDLDACLAMIEAGADRIGTSNSVQILEQLAERLRQ